MAIRATPNSKWAIVGIVAAIAAVACGYSLPAAQQQPQPKKSDEPPAVSKTPQRTEQQRALSRFMQGKLTASQQVLEGLVIEDFDKITKGSIELQKIAEADQWRVSNDAIYRQHSAEYRRIGKRLQTAAEDKNLDGAALAWMEMTMSCIECHRFVRATLIAD
jgi:hypothetical protein